MLTAIINNMINTGSVEIGVTAGDLLVNGSAIAYNSANDLDLFASGNTNFLVGIQNRGSGAISGVAGWNGTTGLTEIINTGVFPPIGALSLNVAAVESDPNAYSNNGGILSVGDNQQLAALAVGSRQGRTSMLGDRVVVAGGINGTGRFAQIGYRGTSVADITGAIHVGSGAGGFVILGSSLFDGFAQVGHGGALAFTSLIDADITFRAQDMTVSAGGANSYAKLGHGGRNYIGSQSGNITALGPIGELNLMGGAATLAFAQIGHGGDGSQGAKAGEISISAEQFTLTGGGGIRSGVQIGHGGRGNQGDLSGNIGLVSTLGGFDLTSGSGAFSTAQIGMGGQFSNGAIGALAPSMINIQSAGDVTLMTGISAQSASFIGHGGANAVSSGIEGDITVEAEGNVSLISGSGASSFTQIGHGGPQSNTPMSGDIAVTSGNNVSIQALSAIISGAYGKIGHGDDMRTVGLAGTGVRSGNIQVSADRSVIVAQGMIGHVNSISNATPSGETWIGVSRANPTDSAGGNLVVDANSEIAGADGLRFYVPRRQNNQVAAGAKLNGITFTGGLSDPTETQRNDEYTRYIQTPNGLRFPNQHDHTLGSGPDPTNAGNFAFYFDTITFIDGPDTPVVPIPTTPPVPQVPPVPPLPPGPDYRGSILDDRAIDDWLREQEGLYSNPGLTDIIYEGYPQYGPNGEAIYDFNNASGSSSSEDEEDILKRQLRLLREQAEQAEVNEASQGAE